MTPFIWFTIGCAVVGIAIGVIALAFVPTPPDPPGADLDAEFRAFCLCCDHADAN